MPEHDGILQLPPPATGQRILYGKDSLQFGELRLPSGDGPHPVAVVVHGGFWRAAYNLEHTGHFCVALNAVGIATWSLEYRRIGNPGGGWPGTFEDVAAGTAYLDKLAGRYSLDLQRVVAAGHSAGGQLALWLASNHNVQGVVALAPVADLRHAFELKLSNNVVQELLGGSPAQFADRYRSVSPIERLPLGTPQRLIHGTADSIVPFEISERYVEAAARVHDEGAQLIPLPRAGHFEPIDPRTPEFEVVRSAIVDLCKMN